MIQESILARRYGQVKSKIQGELLPRIIQLLDEGLTRYQIFLQFKKDGSFSGSRPQF